MEYGDTPSKPSGLKARLFSALDPAAKKEKDDAKRQAIQETLRAREEKIAEEKQFRADVRSGKRKAGVRSYVRSVISERSQSSKARGLEESLHPELKELHKQDREIKNIESRQKWRSRFGKVDNVLDQVNSFLPKDDSKGGGFGGLSQKDINEIAGIGGSGSRKGKSNGGNSFGFGFGGMGGGSGLSQKEINELAGLGSMKGSMFGGMGGGRSSKRRSSSKGKKGKGRNRKSHRRSAPRARSIFDIDI